MKLLKGLVEKGKTVFVVHHDLPQVEKHFDWVIMLNMRLLACGDVTQVFNPDTLFATYGKSFQILEDVMKLSQKKSKGLSL